MYKIRNKEGLYSTGGYCPSFKKRGKIWMQRSHLTNHIRLVAHQYDGDYKDCEVIEVEIRELSSFPAENLVFAKKEEMEKKEAEWHKRREEREKQRELDKLAELKDKYE